MSLTNSLRACRLFLRAVTVIALAGGGVALAQGGATAVGYGDADDQYEPLVARGESPVAGLMAGVGVYDIDVAQVDALAFAGNAVSLRLPLGDGSWVRAEVLRESPVAENARIVEVLDGGVERPITPTIQIFRGALEGDPESQVLVGVSPQQMHGWVHSQGKTWLITTTAPGQGRGVLAYDQSLLATMPAPATPVCAGEIVPEGDVAPPPTGLVHSGGYGERLTNCRAVQLAIDTDNEFVSRTGGAQGATDYAVMMVAASSDIFNREVTLGLRLGYLRIWTATDPWTATDTSTQLTELRSYWRSNMGSVTRATVHLLSGRSLGGGIAYIRAACSNNNGYGVSANLAGSFPFPVVNNSGSNWDVMVITHELGHMFGTEHTHNSCAYNPILDGCGLRTTNSACEQGTQDCTVADADAGTIMSYCHTCAGGMSNMIMTFSSRVQARMNSYISGISCDVDTPPPSLTAVQASPQGTVCAGTPVTLTAMATGSELRYQWFRNGFRLSNSTSPTYTVTNPLGGERFDVMVYSPCGMITTLNAPAGQVQGKTMAVVGAPSIVQQPSPTAWCPSEGAVVSIEANGASQYRWQARDLASGTGWTDLVDGPVVLAGVEMGSASGAGTARLTLSDLVPAWRISGITPGRTVRCIVSAACETTPSVTSNTALVSLCYGDFNCDGGVDGADVEAFYSAWENGLPAADVNADGGVDGSDVEEFFSAWERGGC